MAKESTTIQMAKFIESGSGYEKIANVIQQKGESTLDEIVEATSTSKPTVSRCMTMLINEGLVVKTKKKSGRRSIYRWVGGIPALEDNLLEATSKHVSASLLAETYDTLITDAFALFSILLENNYWEVIVNLKEGLTDTEIHQRTGNDISLDSIRRVLVTCEAHNLIKLHRIREPAGNDFIKLFESLYRIDSVDKNILSDLIMLRGLALAMRFEISNKSPEGYSHPYADLLKLTRNLYLGLLDTILSTNDKEEKELFDKIISKVYDFAPDLDRVYRSENWRQKLKSSKSIIIDEMTDHLLFKDDFTKMCKVNMIKKLGRMNE